MATPISQKPEFQARGEKIPWRNLIGGFLLFFFFHQVYDIVGGGIAGAVLGEGIESIYSHMKMFFYSHLVINAVDFFLHRKQVVSANNFWTSRMLVASSFPWMSIAIWFIPVALGFDLGSIELGYSLLLTVLGLYFAIRLDEGLEHMEFRPALKGLIWPAFAATCITYVGFSFDVPDDFFFASE